MVKETYVAISISSDLAVLKIYSIVLTFMLPNFGNVTNDGRHIKYLSFVFSIKITVVFYVFLYFRKFLSFFGQSYRHYNFGLFTQIWLHE